jgi:PAS domain-containing protein
VSVTGETLIKTSKSSPFSANPGTQAERTNGQLRDCVSGSPILAFVVVAAVLLTIESVSAWRLIEWYPALKPVEPLIETVLDLGVVLPLLLFLFVLPGIRNLRQREVAEAALRGEREKLALRVHERTAELEDSNRRLREEIDRGESARRAIEFQASLLDAVEQAVVALGSEGRILYSNRFAGDLYGWQGVETRGRRVTDILTFLQPDGLPLTERARRGLRGDAAHRRAHGRRDAERRHAHAGGDPGGLSAVAVPGSAGLSPGDRRIFGRV